MGLLSVCTIMRNEARFLPDFLEILRDLADELILVDTGSSDESSQIAMNAGFKVHHFAWVDDFSRARNYSLGLASCEWILVLDVDDRLTIEDRVGFRKNLLNWSDYQGGFVDYLSTRTLSWPQEKKDLFACQKQLRLLRNLPHIRYRGVIHENPLPSIEEQGGKVLETGLPVYHLGYAGELYTQKLERNTRVIDTAIKSDPDNPSLIFYHACTQFKGDQQTLEALYRGYHLANGSLKIRILQKILVWWLNFEPDKIRAKTSILPVEEQLLAMDPLCPIVHFSRARRFFEEEDLEGAIREFSRAEEVLLDAEVMNYRSEIYNSLGTLYAISQNHQKARQYFELLSRESAGTGLYQLLRLALVTGDRVAFEQDFKKASDLKCLDSEKKASLLEAFRQLFPD